jgi:hypothetical protein
METGFSATSKQHFDLCNRGTYLDFLNAKMSNCVLVVINNNNTSRFQAFAAVQFSLFCRIMAPSHWDIFQYIHEHFHPSRWDHHTKPKRWVKIIQGRGAISHKGKFNSTWMKTRQKWEGRLRNQHQRTLQRECYLHLYHLSLLIKLQ